MAPFRINQCGEPFDPCCRIVCPTPDGARDGDQEMTVQSQESPSSRGLRIAYGEKRASGRRLALI